MAAWNIGGALSVTILNVDVRKARCATLEAPNRVKNLSTIVAKKEQACLSTSSRRPRRLSSMCLAVASESTSAPKNPPDCEEAKGSVWETVRFTPSSSQVESLVTDVCDTTSIAEFELDFGGFRLYLKRGLEEAPVSQPASQPTAALPAPPSPPVVNSEVAAAPTSISAALTLSKSKPGSTGIQRFVDSASDEGLAILQSPKVGFFRRSRMIKGKRAPPSCQEKQVVKEGQVLCFIEQLGGEIPIESDVSGEVIKILRKDGEPVGYGDALIAVLPSFPGIKKLQL